MIYTLTTVFFCLTCYYIGLYVGMKKATKIAKKLYREFGIFLPGELKK